MHGSKNVKFTHEDNCVTVLRVTLFRQVLHLSSPQWVKPKPVLVIRSNTTARDSELSPIHHISVIFVSRLFLGKDEVVRTSVT